MPAKAVRSLPQGARRPQGRPPADTGLLALAACMSLHGDEVARLRAKRDRLADGDDRRAMQWNRHLLAAACDRWWAGADRIAALPARSWTGMRCKSEVIHAVAAEREIGDHVADISAADTLCRLATSLAADVQRWGRRRQ